MKYLKRPINARGEASSITGELIEVVTRLGVTGALLRENPGSITSIAINGASRAPQLTAGTVEAGKYKVRAYTSGTMAVNLPILEFHANDAGLFGVVTYTGLGTSITAEYLDDAVGWTKPLTNYTTIEELNAAYPPSTDLETRGHVGDTALVGPDTSGGYRMYISTGIEWLMMLGAAINHAPVASSASITVLKDVGSTIVLTAADADGNPLSYTITSQPAHGTLDTGSSPLLTYTPTIDYTGADSFTFKANDGIADSNIATISLTVANAVRTITVTQPTNGTITPSGSVSVADGGNQAFTITPTSGYSITSLTVDGGTAADTDGSYTFTNITADHTITAVIADTTAPSVTFSAGTPTGLSIPITLSATDGAGVTGYMVKESNNAPAAGDNGWFGTAPTSFTASGYNVTDLYAWAKDAAGNISSVATITGLTLTDPNTFNFNETAGTAPSSAYFTVTKTTNATAVTDGSGNMVLTSPATSDRVVLVRTAAITLAQTKTYSVRAKLAANPAGVFGKALLVISNGAPADNSITGWVIGARAAYSGALRLYLSYYDNTATMKAWDGVANNWTASGTSTLPGGITDYSTIEIITTATNWQIVVKNAAGTAVITTTAVAWSATLSSSNAILFAGDYCSSSESGTLTIDTWSET